VGSAAGLRVDRLWISPWTANVWTALRSWQGPRRAGLPLPTLLHRLTFAPPAMDPGNMRDDPQQQVIEFRPYWTCEIRIDPKIVR